MWSLIILVLLPLNVLSVEKGPNKRFQETSKVEILTDSGLSTVVIDSEAVNMSGSNRSLEEVINELKNNNNEVVVISD